MPTYSLLDPYEFPYYFYRIPPEYDKSNTGIRADPKEDM